MSKIKHRDFIQIVQRYNEKLSNGERAQLRRSKLENIAEIPAFYRLFPNLKTDKRYDRIAFFLPYVQHTDNKEALTLGAQLAKKISEQRLFQVLRSTTPNDLTHLHRLVKQVEPTVNWNQFGETLFFWNKTQKRRLLEDYFLSYTPPKKGSQK